MATTSEVQSGFDQIEARMSADKAKLTQCLTAAAEAYTSLNSMPGDFSDLVSTVQGYDAETGNAVEKHAIALLADLTAEFTILKKHANNIQNLDLAVDPDA